MQARIPKKRKVFCNTNLASRREVAPESANALCTAVSTDGKPPIRNQYAQSFPCTIWPLPVCGPAATTTDGCETPTTDKRPSGIEKQPETKIAAARVSNFTNRLFMDLVCLAAHDPAIPSVNVRYIKVVPLHFDITKHIAATRRQRLFHGILQCHGSTNWQENRNMQARPPFRRTDPATFSTLGLPGIDW